MPKISCPLSRGGGLWPEKKAARQATQPDWIEAQDARDQARLKWILARYDANATLMTIGMDSLRIGRFLGRASPLGMAS